MKCKNCGNEIKENQKFCTRCGYKQDFTKVISVIVRILISVVLYQIIYSAIHFFGTYEHNIWYSLGFPWSWFDIGNPLFSLFGILLYMPCLVFAWYSPKILDFFKKLR